MNKAIKTHKNIIIGTLIAGVAVLGAAYVYSQPQPTPPKAPEASAQKPAPKTPEPVAYTGEKGKTALAQLQETAEVETKASEYGAYVDSINGAKGGEAGKYWTFYVNGKMSSVGAGEYVAKGGEKIEWKFEKMQ